MSYWLLLTAQHITDTYRDFVLESHYEIAPDSKIKKDDTVYLWWVIDGFLYGWGVVSETPRISDSLDAQGRKRLIVTVRREEGFEPPLTRLQIESDNNLVGLIPSTWNDLYAFPIDTLHAHHLNDVIRAHGFRAPEGSAPVGWSVEQIHILKTLRVTGWKSIKETEPPLEFGPVNVMIGANGSGKSNLVSFFKMLNELVGGRLQTFISTSGAAESLLHYGSKRTPLVEGELEFDTPTGSSLYYMRLMHAAVDTLIFSEERVEFHRPDQPIPLRDTLGSGHKESLLRSKAYQGNQTAYYLLRLLGLCRVFHFHDTSETARVRQSAYIEANQHLYPDAGNLASMLYLYKTVHPEVYLRIVSTVRQLVPSFDDFVLEPQRLDRKSILLNWRQIGSDYLFGPHQLSDGSVRAAAIATLFLQPENHLPNLIVLDEPELGLHPQALDLLIGLIRSVSHRTQVILATQSPTLLDYFEPNEIIVADFLEGESHFRRLDEKQLTNWLEDYSVGELWEKNVLGGGPFP